jgi:hypothetical protein
VRRPYTGRDHARVIEDTLDARTLNRTLLARQQLLSRTRLPALEMVDHLVGMQAQEPHDPYLGLWSRLDRFDPGELSRLLSERAAVRLPMLRFTIHLVSARDCLALRPVLAPVMARTVSSQFRRQLEGVDLEELAALGRSLAEQRPRSAAEMRPALLERFPDRDPVALTVAVAAQVPLVQVPPRGLWGQGALPVLARAEDWLGNPLSDDAAPDEMIVRYLEAFGPASSADMRSWCGLAGLREVVDRLRPRLRTFRDPEGRELFDVPDGDLADRDAPAPPRFLPQYDNVFLSHADRSRIVRPEDRDRISFADRFSRPLLLDGFVSGTWRADVDAGRLEIRVATAAPTDGLEQEAVRLLSLLAPGAEPEVVITRG